ncbi:MAG: CAP family protein [Synechococcales bacterium]|nr:CAP family protein [Synechococcales bacterium]
MSDFKSLKPCPSWRKRLAAIGVAVGTIVPFPAPMVYGQDSTAQAQTQTAAQQILDAHNRYRREVDVPPLSWSDDLATDAQVWADYLASLGGNTLQHDGSRTGQGENLWLGTAGFYSVVDAVDAWGSEQQFFRPGTFPDVSTTGNWADVGHYTQIIWRDTEQVGCAQATAGGNNILVCRYSPPGNFIGRPVY